jgi:hypothetical protein
MEQNNISSRRSGESGGVLLSENTQLYLKKKAFCRTEQFCQLVMEKL